MPAASRVDDNATCPSDSHGNDCCSHGVTGPAVSGSPDVFINGKPVLRVGDPGVHSACCGPNTWNCAAGSPTVFVNGLPAVRVGDATTHCGGGGNIVQGSPDVLIGDGSGTSSANETFELLKAAMKNAEENPIVQSELYASADGKIATDAGPISGSDDKANQLCSRIQDVMNDSNVQEKLKKAKELTDNNQYEYGGWIVEKNTGGYDIPELHTSNDKLEVKIPPAPSGTVAQFHTHTNVGVPSFSEDDRNDAFRTKGEFSTVITDSGVKYQDRGGNNIVCDPNQGGPRICEQSGDSEETADDPDCW